MRLKSVCALAALTLAAVTTAVRAETVDLGQGWEYVEAAGGMLPSTDYNDRTFSFTMTNGTISGSTHDDYQYSISITPTAAFTGEPATGVTAPFSGQFTIFNGADPVSTGTVTGTVSQWLQSYDIDQWDDTLNEWVPSGEVEWSLRGFNYTGTFNPTSGAVLDFPAGPVAFQGELGFDGFAFFDGQLSDAPVSAVPLPASATMGLGLIGALGVAQVARRRFRTA